MIFEDIEEYDEMDEYGSNSGNFLLEDMFLKNIEQKNM